jgi:hypothetical protein
MGLAGRSSKLHLAASYTRKRNPKAWSASTNSSEMIHPGRRFLHFWLNYYRGMQDCFRQHPDMYGSELEDDEDELEEELKAEGSVRSSDASGDTPTPVQEQTQPSQPAAREGPEPTVESSKSATKPIIAGDEGGELVPKAAHDGTSK